MNYKQEVMSYIMNGFSSALEVRDHLTEKSVVVNSFLYQGDCFEAFLDTKPVKPFIKISLENILSFEKIKENEYKICYEKGEGLSLIEKKQKINK